MPPKVKKRGRLKGTDMTVIGLPSKKARKDNKAKIFRTLSPAEKEIAMLGWLLHDHDIIDEVRCSRTTRIVEKNDLKRVDAIPHHITDDSVTIWRIKRFFSIEAWQSVQKAVEKLKRTPWKCSTCLEDLRDQGRRKHLVRVRVNPSMPQARIQRCRVRWQNRVMRVILTTERNNG